MNASSLRARVGLALALAQSAGLASAATFNVTRFDDPVPDACLPADCSLREAVIAANALPDSDAIMLGAGVYELTQTGSNADPLHRDLDITAPVTINGLGSTLTTLRMALPPGHEQRVIDVRYVALGLSGLTIRDGSANMPMFNAGQGGCLMATGMELTLDDVRFTNCEADYGGALLLIDVDAQMDGVTIDGNRARYGGGMEIAGSSLRGAGNVIARNTASISGGGIRVSVTRAYRESRIGWSTDSQIIDNSATSFGGGIQVKAGAHLVIDPVAPATVGNGELLRIEGNDAGQRGGGISLSEVVSDRLGGSLDARRVALRNNRADIDGGALHAGGRFFLSDSEVLQNTAGTDGGGIAVREDAAESRIERVSFAHNAARNFGGAVSNTVQNLAVINTTTYRNSANIGGGAFDLRGYTTLNQVTSFSDTSSLGASVRLVGATVSSQNSVFTAGCHATVPGQFIIDEGGNAQVTGQATCTGTYYTSTQLRLRYGYYGGRFPIVGTGTTSVLRNAAQPYGGFNMRDIRNQKRSLPTDIGAYDGDALP